jgi:hypothetical protein
MKLRDHPLMKRKNGFQTWPPAVTITAYRHLSAAHAPDVGVEALIYGWSPQPRANEISTSRNALLALLSITAPSFP